MKTTKEDPIFGTPYFSNVEYDRNEFIEYWRNRKHAYVCSSKVGSTTIRSILLENLNIPFIYQRQNQLARSAKHHDKELTPEALEGEKELRERCVLYLVRCPFHRVVSSYEYRTHNRFGRPKQDYSAKNQNVDSMNIVEYIEFIANEIKAGHYNSLIEHFYPQKKSFLKSAFAGTKISTLWQTERIQDLIEIWQDAFKVKLDVQRRLNSKIRDRNRYHQYYESYPELFELVKTVFKEDLDWLNRIFDYEGKFLQAL